MGRRIYDDGGEFVWKYTFGRQDSEMIRYAAEFGIGKYEDSKLDNSEWVEHIWIIPKDAVDEY